MATLASMTIGGRLATSLQVQSEFPWQPRGDFAMWVLKGKSIFEKIRWHFTESEACRDKGRVLAYILMSQRFCFRGCCPATAAYGRNFIF